MNKNMMMIMGGALVMALIVAMIVQAKLGKKDEDLGTQILIANKRLLVGEKLKAEDVQWRAWSDSALFEGVVVRGQQEDEENLDVYDALLKRSIQAGEPIVRQALIIDGKGTTFLAASIMPGMRAVSVGVKPETAVAGFVGPGDYVDVILSYTPKLSGELQLYSGDVVQNYASETILSNVRVLAVDQKAKLDEEEKDSKKTISAKTVTLEVDKAGAETLTLAQNMGEISLSLRRLGDEDTEADLKSTLTTDMSRSAVIRRVEKEMINRKTASDTIRVYSGSSIQNVPVRATGDK